MYVTKVPTELSIKYIFSSTTHPCIISNSITNFSFSQIYTSKICEYLCTQKNKKCEYLEILEIVRRGK